MDSREERRLAIARRVSALLREDASFRDWLTFRAPDDSRPMVVALADDTVGEIFGRIASRYPTGANVIVGDAETHVTNMVVEPHPHDVSPFGVFDGDCPIHKDTEIAMLLGYLVLRQGSATRFMVINDYAAELVPDPAFA